MGLEGRERRGNKQNKKIIKRLYLKINVIISYVLREFM